MKPYSLLTPMAWLMLTLSLPSRADLAKGLDAAAREDWRTAYQEFKEPAARGNSNAAVNLGNLYMRGLGVTQDYAQARAWYEKAALDGNPIGEAKLGVLYYLGLGVEENRTRAAEWFQKAGDQGDAHSAMTLAEMYLAGDGVSESRTEAYVWYTIASELGHRPADEPRMRLAAELPAQEINGALERVDIWRKSYAIQVEKAARLSAKKATPPPAGNEAQTTPAKADTKTKAPAAERSRKKKSEGLKRQEQPKG